MGILDVSLKRLGALLVNKRWRINAGLNTELIFHADVPKNCHAFVNRAEIQMTRLLLDIFPADVQTYAGQMWVCADLSFEGIGFVAALDRLRHPQTSAERWPRDSRERSVT